MSWLFYHNIIVWFFFTDSSSIRSFSSQEGILDSDFESDPEPPGIAELQESEQAELADHKIPGSKNPEITVNSAPIGNEGEIKYGGHEIEPGDQAEANPHDETIMDVDYEADDESDGELNDTVVAAQGAQPSVDACAIETMHIVHPNGQLNHPVAETSDEVLEVVEQVPHANLSPEAIVNEVEAVQVAVPVEANGPIVL